MVASNNTYKYYKVSDFQNGTFPELLQGNKSCAAVTNKDVVVVCPENSCGGEEIVSYVCALVGGKFLLGNGYGWRGIYKNIF